MTDAELDRLAELIARALLDGARGGGAPANEGSRARESWVPAPVRPEPPTRGSEPPVWTGAAQRLEGVAPGPRTSESSSRVSTGELTVAVRAAAAGGAAPRPTPVGRSGLAPGRPRPAGASAIDVRIGVSRRHVHLSSEHVRALFGRDLTQGRPLSQPGQFAANETVQVVGPKGKLDEVRVVGPARGETQLEVARTDAAALGIDPPVAASGSLEGSIGGVTLIGPSGRVELAKGVIVAGRHLHLAPEDARRWGLRDGDRLDVRCGEGVRAVLFHDVLVRAGTGHSTELHLDSDEANAAGVGSGDSASIVAWRSGGSARRRLVTERDVVALARSGGRIPDGALLTPSARDRAVALGLIAR